MEDCAEKTLQQIKSLNLKPPKKITKESFKEDYDKFRENLTKIKNKISTQGIVNPSNKYESDRDKFFLNYMYNICEYKSDKISFYKRAHQMRVLILSYIGGKKHKEWNKYLKKFPYNDNYNVKKNDENLKTVKQYLKSAEIYFVTLCELLGKEDDVKELEISNKISMIEDTSSIVASSESIIEFFDKEGITLSESYGSSNYNYLRSANNIYKYLLRIKHYFKKNNPEKYKELLNEFPKEEIDNGTLEKWFNSVDESIVKSKVKAKDESEDEPKKDKKFEKTKRISEHLNKSMRKSIVKSKVKAKDESEDEPKKDKKFEKAKRISEHLNKSMRKSINKLKNKFKSKNKSNIKK